MTVAALLDAARAKGLMIATAESCTGGLVSAAMTEIAGSSDVFECGFITYSNAAKTQMLRVDPATIAAFGAVSEEVALQMARGARQHSRADIAVSITGIAGPGGSDHKPEGRVCFGLATGGETSAHTIDFGPLGRAHVRRAAVNHAISILQQAVDSTLPNRAPDAGQPA
tara:strand:- start:156 stop:662 length:507 start_codon:yes stop_codon:yes gene_type:complete